MAAGRALMASRSRSLAVPYRPVEKGVTGREKTFQQNRNFGPGAFVPYPQREPAGRSRFQVRPIPNVRSEPERQRA